MFRRWTRPRKRQRVGAFGLGRVVHAGVQWRRRAKRRIRRRQLGWLGGLAALAYWARRRR